MGSLAAVSTHCHFQRPRDGRRPRPDGGDDELGDGGEVDAVVWVGDTGEMTIGTTNRENQS
jgi:hypothetical protein